MRTLYESIRRLSALTAIACSRVVTPAVVARLTAEADRLETRLREDTPTLMPGIVTQLEDRLWQVSADLEWLTRPKRRPTIPTKTPADVATGISSMLRPGSMQSRAKDEPCPSEGNCTDVNGQAWNVGPGFADPL